MPVDTSAGSVTVTLPTTPADKSRIGIKMINVSSTNAVTINASGSDVFNKAGGSTSLTLSLLNQGVLLQYASSPAIWYVQVDDLPLPQLDSRYVEQTSLGAASGVATLNSSSQLTSNQLPSSVVTGNSVTKTSTYAIQTTDQVVLVDATSSSFTVTLPTAVGFSSIYSLKAITTNNNIVTVQTTSSQTIDGAAPPIQLGIQASGATWQSVGLVSDGSNWRIVEGVPNGAATVTTSMLAAGGFGSSLGNTISPHFLGTPASTSMASGNLGFGTSFYIQVDIPWPRTITGVGYFVGSARDSSNVMAAGIYSAAGTFLARSSTSVAQPATSQQHLVPFDSPYAAAAGTYFIGLGSSSSSGTYYGVPGAAAPWTTASTFGAMSTSTLTLPTKWTVPGSTIPVCWAY